MKLDPTRSRLALYTFAEGLFSALAHDLELVATELAGEATNASAELNVTVAALRVSGVMKRGKLDTGVLSANDRATIERQIREEVLPIAQVVARGTLAGSRASIEVTAAKGTARVACDVAITDESGGARRAKGSTEVALSALGAPPVKGPMGAFKVRDKVRVDFDLCFTP